MLDFQSLESRAVSR